MTRQYSNCYDHYFQIYGLEFFYQILPWEWFKAQAIAESGLDPLAVSPAGALGVMQLMPGTGAEMARKVGLTAPAIPGSRGISPSLDVNFTPQVPHVNIRLGIAYNRQCWEVWKKEAGIERIRFMFGSYNAGVGNILEAQDLAGRSGLATDNWLSIISALPQITGNKHAAETIGYVARIERLYAELTKEKTA